MEESKVRKLLKRYQTGDTNPRETALIEEWLIQEGTRAPEPSAIIDYDAVGDRIWSKLNEQHHADLRIKIRKLWIRITSVAATVTAILLGIWFYESASSPKVSRNDAIVYSNDIDPAKNRATLLLSNGKTFQLSDQGKGVTLRDGAVAYVDSTAITRLEDAPFLTVRTPRGGTYQVTLPDGTQVWLNAESSIRYPATFDGDTRDVRISGEVYFEVVRNIHKKFRVVVNDKTSVEVLGTRFNVMAYPDFPKITTTLVDGKVRVFSDGADRQASLLPGQQADVMSATGRIHVQNQVDTTAIVAWKNNKFNFQGMAFTDIMKQLERWYDIEVTYEGAIPSYAFYGELSRQNSLHNILKVLKESSVRFRLEGRRLTIHP